MHNLKRVYVLGAGVNQSIHFQNNYGEVYEPPMSNNFFKIALSMEEFISDYYDWNCNNLSDYIEKYWKLKKNKLVKSRLDIEHCFTMLQLQRWEANMVGNIKREEELAKIHSNLFTLLISILKDFKWANLSPAFIKFGEILYKERPMILTFNYDDFIERAIEHASRKNKSGINTSMLFANEVKRSDRKRVITNSEWTWNRPLGYGIEFDDVMLYDGAQGPNREKFFKKDEFYCYNNLYSWNILKLHGSLNWWQFTKFSPNQALSKGKIKKIYMNYRKKISLQERDVVPGFAPFTLKEQLYVEPIIITPELHKTYYSPGHVYGGVR